MPREKTYDEQLIQSFLECKTIKEIVERTGLSRKTVSRYKEDAEFQKKLASRKMYSIKVALNRMQLSLSDVTDEVLNIVKNQEVSPQVRLNAAQILMSQCRNWTETEDMLERLEKLENAIQENNDSF